MRLLPPTNSAQALPASPGGFQGERRVTSRRVTARQGGAGWEVRARRGGGCCRRSGAGRAAGMELGAVLEAVEGRTGPEAVERVLARYNEEVTGCWGRAGVLPLPLRGEPALPSPLPTPGGVTAPPSAAPGRGGPSLLPRARLCGGSPAVTAPAAVPPAGACPV